MPSRRTLAALLTCLVLVGCADAGHSHAPTSDAPIAQASSACNGSHTFPPVGPLIAPAGIAASHVSGLTVRIANGTTSPWSFRVSRWIDDPCGGWTADGPGTFGAIDAGAAVEASATGDVPVPPYLIGVEVWDHPCDASCVDVPTGTIGVPVAAEAASPAATAAPSASGVTKPRGGGHVYQDTFTIAGTMLGPAPNPQALLLPDGRVFVLGENDPGTGDATLSEIFDPRAGTFAAVDSFDVPNGAVGVVLRDGRVLALGGISAYPANEAVARAEIVDAQTGRFTELAPMRAARYMHTALLLPDGRVLVLGGQTERDAVTTVELFDPATQSFTEVPMVTPRSPFSAVVIDEGRVLVFGGSDASRSGLVKTPEIFDPATNTFSEANPMNAPRAATGTLLRDGRVLVWPGLGADYLDYVQQVELFDPGTGDFTAIGPMVSPRFHPEAVVLRDGRVLVQGGNTSRDGAYSRVTTAELYDPVSNVFSALPPMVLPRYGVRQVPLTDGRALIFGGYHDGIPTPYAPEILDPVAPAFMAAPPMAVNRSGDADVLLDDGRVLVLGGLDSTGRPAVIAELFQ